MAVAHHVTCDGAEAGLDSEGSGRSEHGVSVGDDVRVPGQPRVAAGQRGHHLLGLAREICGNYLE